jgi:glucokinase
MGNLLFEGSIKTKGHGDIHQYMQKLSYEINKLLTGKEQEYEIAGIGIGAPNGNYYNGCIEEAPNLEWKGTIHFVDLIKEKFNVPAWLTNDANAAAMGEMIYGGAQGMKDFLCITLGTGVGSGIVANGELIYGHDGFAGEIGHTLVVDNGRKCGCGRCGCLETYASATGIKRTAVELLENNDIPSLLRNIDKRGLDSKFIYEAAKKGDPIAKKCFEITIDILGKALANSVAYTSPEAIFIFGGLAKAHDLLIQPLKEKMEEYLLNIYKGKVNILASKLEGSKAAILGASALVWKEL